MLKLTLSGHQGQWKRADLLLRDGPTEYCRCGAKDAKTGNFRDWNCIITWSFWRATRCSRFGACWCYRRKFLRCWGSYPMAHIYSIEPATARPYYLMDYWYCSSDNRIFWINQQILEISIGPIFKEILRIQIYEIFPAKRVGHYHSLELLILTVIIQALKDATQGKNQSYDDLKEMFYKYLLPIPFKPIFYGNLI